MQINRLGALKRTRTGVTDGCQDAWQALYGSALAHPTLVSRLIRRNRGKKAEWQRNIPLPFRFEEL